MSTGREYTSSWSQVWWSTTLERRRRIPPASSFAGLRSPRLGQSLIPPASPCRDRNLSRQQENPNGTNSHRSSIPVRSCHSEGPQPHECDTRLAAMGKDTVTDNFAFNIDGGGADSAETGSYIHTFTHDSAQTNYTPYMSVRRFLEGGTATGVNALGQQMH